MTNGTKKTEEPRSAHCCRRGFEDFGSKIILTLVGVLIVYGTFYIGTLMRNEIKKYDYIGQADIMERTITVTGFAKVNGMNDIAVTTIGFTNSNTDVSVAQQESKTVMDKVFADLKVIGIEERDMQTQYSIYPEYDYTDRGSNFKGYRVNNNLTVKIRDLSKISSVLSLPGKHGANQVGGLSFTIDDTESLKVQAREKALLDAKDKAQKLSQLLGVRLGEIVSYTDYEAGQPYPYAYDSFKGMRVEGMGGAAPAQIAGGSQDVSMNVNVVYKILPARR